MFDDPVTGPFLPTDIPGCACWLECTRPGAVTVSGSSVVSWNDQSGNGASATPFSVHPQFPPGAKAINFAGYNTGMNLTTSSFSAALQATVVFVFTTAASLPINLPRFIAFWDGDQQNEFEFRSPHGFIPLLSSGGNFGSYCNTFLCTVHTCIASTQFIGIGTVDDVSGVNTLSVGGSSSSDFFTDIILNPMTRILIGCDAFNQQGFNGLAYEFLAWPRVLTNAEIVQLKAYLRAKYPLAI